MAGRFKLLFFGSDAFSVRILDHLLKKRLCPIHIVTKSSNQFDRFAAANELKRHRWPLSMDSISDYNIGLVASFGQLIDVDTIEKFQEGLFNVHPSLLPQFRGSSPVQAAILNGLSETGCTIMRIPPVAKFDIGDIILQDSLTIRRGEYAIELRDRLADMGAGMIERLLIDYDKCLLNSRPQLDKEKSFAKKIKPSEGMLKFSTESLELIGKKVRAYTGFVDIFTTCLNGMNVRLESMKNTEELEKLGLNEIFISYLRKNNVVMESNHILPGTMFFYRNRHILCINCAGGGWIGFDFMTPEGKPRMTSLDFYNGYLSKVDWTRRRADI